MKTLSMSPLSSQTAKQPYEKPDVTEYGSVAALTQEASALGLIVVASVTATVLGGLL
jgi:hypothetical protein